MNEEKEHPFWTFVGVSGVIALILVLTVVYLAVVGKEIPQPLQLALAAVVAWYFTEHKAAFVTFYWQFVGWRFLNKDDEIERRR